MLAEASEPSARERAARTLPTAERAPAVPL